MFVAEQERDCRDDGNVHKIEAERHAAEPAQGTGAEHPCHCGRPDRDHNESRGSDTGKCPEYLAP
ncbi:hypothetical protein GCM10027416_03090 [Okibacterium endophyticum]